MQGIKILQILVLGQRKLNAIPLMNMIRTYKYRLYPSQAQTQRLFQVLAVCRHWYNMCLEERKLAWEIEKRQVTKSKQQAKGTLYRKTFPQAKIVFSQTLQSVADDLDKAFRAFFPSVQNR